MRFAARIKKDFRSTAEGMETLATRSSNLETKATFLKLARAYRQLAEQMGNCLSGFPSLESGTESLCLPQIWLGAGFCGTPINEAHSRLFMNATFPTPVGV